MQRISWMIFCWVVLASSAQASSFDCAKAGTKVEKLICGDAEISKLDEELSAAYKTALQDGKQADTTRQAQKRWMKERNGCSDAACVKRAYEARLKTLDQSDRVTVTDSAGTTDAGGNVNQEAEGDSQNDQQYHFHLTKGKGIPVCDAYLERLNTTKYEKPPYCDRPENDAIKGFTKLNRVPLSPNDVRDLYPIVWSFMSNGNRGSINWWADMVNQQQMSQTGQFKLSEAGTKYLQMYLDAGWAKMWRYAPPIDIDNDGVPDNIEVWHGAVLPHGVGGRQCGDDGFPITHYGISIRQPQVAFVVTGNNDRLDVIKTEKIFAHPKGGYPLYMDGHWRMADDFRPIGDSMGIFKYQDIYYFDTFFDGWGDFEGKRRTEGALNKHQKIFNTLAVFLHKNGKTRQVCEYLMTDNETQNERGTK